MTQNPYKSAPPRAFWRRSVSTVPPAQVDLLEGAEGLPTITKSTPVVSAGSCFASNIARYLREAGFNYLITENLHPAIFDVNPEWYRKKGYGVFSAMYENIYTARQMLQLLQRVYGIFSPVEDRWTRADGAVIDPFRPNLPHPANSNAEFDALQRQHFAGVRRAFETAEVFIFTLGLTEAWISRVDGSVYPACPGTVEGEFDPRIHEFVNFGVESVHDDICAAVQLLREHNPRVKVILTVSPVPLVATATDKHVVVATSYSKSVLRVAAEMATSRCSEVWYFPSFEVITGPQSRGAYFEADRRSVSEQGIAHVMRLFFKHLTDHAPSEERAPHQGVSNANLTELAEELAERACVEELVEVKSRVPLDAPLQNAR